MRSLPVFAALILLTAVPALGQPHRHTERVYQEAWCAAHGGEPEHVLPDRTRVDCLTATHAVEVDFAAKWAEGIGQALYYADQTGRRPGVLLILEKEGDARFLARINRVASGHGIDVWTTTPAQIDQP